MSALCAPKSGRAFAACIAAAALALATGVPPGWAQAKPTVRIGVLEEDASFYVPSVRPRFQFLSRWIVRELADEGYEVQLVPGLRCQNVGAESYTAAGVGAFLCVTLEGSYHPSNRPDPEDRLVILRGTLVSPLVPSRPQATVMLEMGARPDLRVLANLFAYEFGRELGPTLQQMESQRQEASTHPPS